MSKVHETLKRKNDTSVEVYPNIERENIPNGAVNTAKLEDGSVTNAKIYDASINSLKIIDGAVLTNKIHDAAVTTDKLADGSVTTDKINDAAVTTAKINNSAVTTAKIGNGAVTNDKLAEGSVKALNLDNDLYEMLLRTNYTYMIYLGNNNDTSLHFFKPTTLDSSIHDYTEEDLYSALDFDKNIDDYTRTDISILKDIIDGMQHLGIGGYYFHSIISDNVQFDIYKSNVNHYYITMQENGVYTFKLEFDENLNIIELVHTSYIYMFIIRMINPNVHYE